MSRDYNIGLTTSSRSVKSDEQYTPFYAVAPLIENIGHLKGLTVWCPFDHEWSAFVVALKENGFKVINTHLETGQDFFEYEPEQYDLIISNPPFSKKDKVLERLDQLGKPFAILLPINSLQGKRRFKNMQDIQLLYFDDRIGFHKELNTSKAIEGSPFATGYFCKGGVLTKDLIGVKLNKYERALIG